MTNQHTICNFIVNIYVDAVENIFSMLLLLIIVIVNFQIKCYVISKQPGQNFGLRQVMIDYNLQFIVRL